MQRRRAGTVTACAIAASAVVLASCNAIFGLSSGTVGEPPDAATPDAATPDASGDGPAPEDGGGPDMAMQDAARDAAPDTPTIDAMLDAPIDAAIDGPTCLLDPASDEDGDGLANSTDPCPHVSGTQIDSDSDGHGDDCDPYVDPGTSLTFIGFGTGFPPCNWTVVGTWTFANGGAMLTGTQLTQSSIRRDATIPDTADATVVARFDPPGVDAPGDQFAVAVFGSRELSCWYVRVFGPDPSDRIEVRTGVMIHASMNVNHASSPRLELSVDPVGNFTCGLGDGEAAPSAKVGGNVSAATGLSPGIMVPNGSTALVRYIGVYEQP